jgi:hypothetical protein
MAKTTSIEELAERIERLVQEHIAASRGAAQAAVDRAFSAAACPVSAPVARQKRGAGRQRRAPDEIAGLGERLYEAVCAKPGETMSVLREAVGASARDLERPMALLKQSGRVRSVGARNRTRYFPMPNRAAASR